MPRQSRSSRPAPRAAPAAPAQTRSASTAAMPAQSSSYSHPHAPAPPAAAAASSGPGMLGQMAATAGSVAIGSTIGHGLSNMLFGGGSRDAPVAAADTPVAQQAPTNQYAAQGGVSCSVQAKEFTQCLEKADLPSCTWYLEQLKACQAAAAPY